MPRKNKSTDLGLVAAMAAVAFAMLFGASSAEAQMTDLGPATQETTDFRMPGFENFCAGNACPGQTCDEVNDVCVGSVTLQPAMGEPLVGLSAFQRTRFDEGKLEFNRVFVAADGLGPVFNQNSCSSCHNNPVGGSGSITVTRFGEITVVGTDLIFDPLAQFGGSLLNKESISDECAEIIPVPPTNVASQRLTNSTLGFGLVENIPDADIEFNAINPPAGVSGRTTIVPVLEQPGTEIVGRFGWKLQLGTVLSFTADASLQEMGITTRIFPEDNPPNNDLLLLADCDTVADPEDVPNANGDEFLDLATDFQRFLAAPPQTPRSGMTGETLFNAVGCADCHISGFQAVSDDEDGDALAGAVNAYSDFLLHDMGNNGDFIEQGQAGLTEIRTTPLWGLRVRDPMWHDGRVAGGNFNFRIFNAVFNHDTDGSESQASAQAYFALSPVDQSKVVSFLDSLGRREFDVDGNGFVNDGDILIIDDCVLQGGPFTPDDLCAIADADQNGFVDEADLELLDVVLGIVLGDDEDEDEDEDESGDGGFLEADFEGEGSNDSGMSGLEADPIQSSDTPTAGAEETEQAEPKRRPDLRRRVSRRGL